ncbi:MAG TPA: invasion associated locus B family protein [Aestuariivirgaceae bacterium]|nr:invasion associated locus B family protein [Aestuariivirgaceae bacterium]
MTAKVTFDTMMIRKIALSFLMAAAAALLAGAPAPAQAQAQDPKLLGEFQDWAAYTYQSDSGPVCYIVSQPTDWEPKNVNRGPIFFLITHRPSERVRNEVNTIIGYPFKEDSTATVTVGDKNFELFTSGDGAWADTADRDRQIVEAMKVGSTMSLKGLSWRGTETRDRYSLSGVTNAMNRIDAECE